MNKPLYVFESTEALGTYLEGLGFELLPPVYTEERWEMQDEEGIFQAIVIEEDGKVYITYEEVYVLHSDYRDNSEEEEDASIS